MTAIDMMDTVEAALRQRYPNEKVYRDHLPKGFSRPCFTLELQSEGMRDLNVGLVRRETKLLITCYEKANTYGDSSRDKLNERLSAVLELFAAGSMVVNGFEVRVVAVAGTGAPDFSEVTADLSWVDVRPGYVDPALTDTPPMENFNFNINGKD